MDRAKGESRWKNWGGPRSEAEGPWSGVGGRGRAERHNISLGQDVNSVFFFVFLEEIDLIASDFLEVSGIDRP